MDALDQVDRALKNWVEAVLEDTHVTFAAPCDISPDDQVCLYLKDVIYRPLSQTVSRANAQPTVTLSLNYVVTTWHSDPILAHQALEVLLLAAIENPTFSIQTEPIPLAMWQAFQIPPRPAFILYTVLEIDRPRSTLPIVRHPPVVQVASVSRMQGVILGPGDVPIAGARIMLPHLHRSTYSDADGMFGFEAVPSDGPWGPMKVQAKGYVFSVVPEELSRNGAAFIIHLNDLV